MSKRPKIDPTVSTSTKRALLAIQDMAEALEEIYVDLHYLDELGRVQGRSGGAKDEVLISRPVEAEMIALSPIWEAQKKNLETLLKARSGIVGVRHMVAKATFRGDIPDEPKEANMEEMG
jgi:hypothetical protein